MIDVQQFFNRSNHESKKFEFNNKQTFYKRNNNNNIITCSTMFCCPCMFRRGKVGSVEATTPIRIESDTVLKIQLTPQNEP